MLTLYTFYYLPPRRVTGVFSAFVSAYHAIQMSHTIYEKILTINPLVLNYF